MLTGLIITILIVVALGASLRSEQTGRLISRTPYNNRHNDASGARDEHVG